MTGVQLTIPGIDEAVSTLPGIEAYERALATVRARPTAG